MVKYLTIVFVHILVTGCPIQNTESEPANIPVHKTYATHKDNILSSNSLEMSEEKIHVFKSKNGKILGYLYVTLIAQDVFNKLVIKERDKDNADTLYYINHNQFFNKKGIDITLEIDGLEGYKIILIRDDYIVLTCFENGRSEVSDDITIEWNYDRRLFEVKKTP